MQFEGKLTVGYNLEYRTVHSFMHYSFFRTETHIQYIDSREHNSLLSFDASTGTKGKDQFHRYGVYNQF